MLHRFLAPDFLKTKNYSTADTADMLKAYVQHFKDSNPNSKQFEFATNSLEHLATDTH